MKISYRNPNSGDLWLATVFYIANQKEPVEYMDPNSDPNEADIRVGYDSFLDVDKGILGKSKKSPSVARQVLKHYGYNRLADSLALVYLDIKEKQGTATAYKVVQYPLSKSLNKVIRTVISLPVTDNSVIEATRELLNKSQDSDFDPDSFTLHNLFVWYLDHVDSVLLENTLSDIFRADLMVNNQSERTTIVLTKGGYRVGILNEVPVHPSSILQLNKLSALLTPDNRKEGHFTIFSLIDSDTRNKIVEVVTTAEPDIELVKESHEGYIMTFDLSALPEDKRTANYIWYLFKNYV